MKIAIATMLLVLATPVMSADTQETIDPTKAQVETESTTATEIRKDAAAIMTDLDGAGQADTTQPVPTTNE